MKPIVRSFLLTGLLSAALMVLVACNSAITETDATSPDSGEVGDAGTQADTDAAQISSSLPADFPVIVYQGAGLSQGDQVMFSELVAQGKPVVLNFWAGLCPPCRLEMPTCRQRATNMPIRFS